MGGGLIIFFSQENAFGEWKKEAGERNEKKIIQKEWFIKLEENIPLSIENIHIYDKMFFQKRFSVHP